MQISGPKLKTQVTIKQSITTQLSIVAALVLTAPTYAAQNALQAEHQQRLQKAQVEESTAKSAWDKAYALKQQAAELDSLGKSAQALTVIDRALGFIQPEQDKDFIATKAGILFSMNNPTEALTLLQPRLDAIRKLGNAEPDKRISFLGTYTEGFVTATFAHIQLEQWQEAINTLADAEGPLEGPSFYAYRGLVYRYIMSRAKNPALADPKLEKSAAYYTQNDKSHYGALLRMWQGSVTPAEVDRMIGQMSDAEQQDALAEALFYSAAYAKFVRDDSASARQKLDQLNRLAPYGSIEWIY